MPSLEIVNVAINSLTGTIPTTLGNLANVQLLHLGDNLFTGTIPSEQGQISSLAYLNLELNSFTESTNGSICDFLDGLPLYGLYIDCDELECPCCSGCCGNDFCRQNRI